MIGPCAKRRVICRITAADGRSFVGENSCANAQPMCPRNPGEGYEKCQTICEQAGHAEIEALKLAGAAARGASAELWGHYWICEPCGRALLDAGVLDIAILRGELT